MYLNTEGITSVLNKTKFNMHLVQYNSLQTNILGTYLAWLEE